MSRVRFGGGAWLLVPGVFLAPGQADSHEVPASATVQVILRPDDDRLHVLVRAPLEAMQEMRLPVDVRGVLDLGEARESGVLRRAAELWLARNLDLFQNGEKLQPARIQAVRVSLPSDRSFRGFDQALTHIRGPPLPATTRIPWRQALLDVELEAPLVPGQPTAASRFSVDPRFGRLGLRVLTVIRYESPDGEARVLQLAGEPGRVRLDPNRLQASTHFLALGFEHILSGLDHLLFLVCLVAPLRRLRRLVLVVTAFTVAHSITLLAAAAGIVPRALWFPTLVEVLIALSIVYMAFDNILGVWTSTAARGDARPTGPEGRQSRRPSFGSRGRKTAPRFGQERRVAAAFGFGLIHGFGFSFALSESLQFAGSHLVMSLLAFNVGVELGQILVLLLLVPLFDLVLQRLPSERAGIILVSALIVHTAWHWTGDRASDLLQYRPLDPLLDAVPQGALPWVLVAAAAAVPAWRWLMRRRSS